MTLFGIDISHHQAGINLQAVKDEGFKYVFARVGQAVGGNYGTTKDREWARHRDESRRVGLKLCAYWYIGNGTTAAENARLCSDWIGDKSIPVALDCEAGSGNIQFFKDVLQAFRDKGMRVPLSYIPRWYWQGTLGSPSLAGLPLLWSSRYVSGGGVASQLYPGDNSAFWNGYGNNIVIMLQFTNSARIAGYIVDANAFKGTEQDLDYLFTGNYKPPAPPPIPPPNPIPPEIDMQLTDVVGYNPNGTPYTVQDVLSRQYNVAEDKGHAQLLIELRIAIEQLPETVKEVAAQRYEDIARILYSHSGQANWEEVKTSGVTWGDLAASAKKWGDV